MAELVTSLDPDAWDRLIASFAAAAEAEIDHIIDAIGSDQSPARAAHTLKGLAWNTGAMLLGNLAQQLETAASAEAKRVAAELRPVLERSITALMASTLSHAES